MKQLCSQCGKDSVIGGICISCNWHIKEQRMATTEEIEDAVDFLDVAIAGLEVVVDEDITRDDRGESL